MKVYRKNFIGFVFMLSIACSTPKKGRIDEIRIAKPLDSLITALIENNELVGAELNIVQNGSPYNKVYGWRDLSKEEKVQTNDIWAVKSMTKPITATAILMLRDDGLLSLDDVVTNYIPSYQGYPQTTIKNLLLQNSGDDGSYGNHSENIFDFSNQADWVLDWANQKPTGTFGEYEYSNFNYEALGYIIATVSQQSVEKFLDERIIKPLGLKNTHTNFSPANKWADRVPFRYKMKDNNEIELMQTNQDEQPWKFFPASFGLWMSNEDFVTFLQLWMNGGRHGDLQLVKESTIEEALQIGAWINKEDHAGQGLGWQIEEDPYVYYKGGNDGSIGITYPDKNMIIVFTTHMQGGKQGVKIWDVLSEHLLNGH